MLAQCNNKETCGGGEPAMFKPKELTRREIVAGAASAFVGGLFSHAQEAQYFQSMWR
jgi:hypothetical protein